MSYCHLPRLVIDGEPRFTPSEIELLKLRAEAASLITWIDERLAALRWRQASARRDICGRGQ